MAKPYVLWPALAGTLVLLAGLVLARRAWRAAYGLDKLLALAPVLIASPLATFGAEHMVVAQYVAQGVPAWMPARLFWAYFVGFALFAAAISLVTDVQLRLSATLLGVMFVLFVLMLHVPDALAHPGDRFKWAVALRDLAFAGGALAFSATGPGSGRGATRLVTLGRVLVAVPLLFFAVEHLLHPEFLPGVPLPKLTPVWIPARQLWGYLTGAAELAAAAALLARRHSRVAATALGLWLVALTALVYPPVLAAARQSPEIVEGINYLADTLLFAGTVLALAAAMPKGRLTPAAEGGGSAARQTE